MQRYTPTILSFKLLWDKAIVLVLPHYRILPFVSKISCPGMLVTCLWITQRRLKSFTSRFTQRLNQFLPSRLEIVQSLQVVKSRALGSHLTAFSLLKLTSTTFVALLHVLFTTSEKLGTSYLDLLRNVLFVHFFFSKLDSCNSILHGLPSYELEKLQRLQNTTARLTVRAKCRLVITPVWRVYTGSQWKKELFLKFSWSRTKSSMALLQPI